MTALDYWIPLLMRFARGLALVISCGVLAACLAPLLLLPSPTDLMLSVLKPLVGLDPKGSGHTFLFVVDRTAITHPDRPVLVVDLNEEPGRTFRVIPSKIWGVENNLSIANMDFGEFADAVDSEGVFRGFPES